MTATYLLAWNPERWPWENLDDSIRQTQETGRCDSQWSVGSVRNIAAGSRFFLIRLAAEPRGLVASGAVTSSPREVQHWDSERAAQGEATMQVDVRFDVISRVPLVRRLELKQPPFDQVRWDTQMSGIRIPDEVASELERLWAERHSNQNISDVVVRDEHLRPWRDAWRELQADAEIAERYRLVDDNRRRVLPEIRDLVNSFIEGRTSLEDFRDVFDHKTRSEWDLFGLKGLSGAMFLNKLVKHLEDADELSAQLKSVLRVPADEADARAKLDGFARFLHQQIESGAASAGELQPRRAPFLVSACWHVQSPDEWPILYESARKALQSAGLLGQRLEGADGYLEFRRVFRSVARRLELAPWELEHLCMERDQVARELDREAEEEEESSEGPVAATRQRVWLYAPGERASEWEDFYDEGIMAIGWGYLGDLRKYEDQDSIRDALRSHLGGTRNPHVQALGCWQFANDIEVGDVVFAKRGRKEIVGYGIVTSAYRYDPSRGDYPHVRSVNWKMRGAWVPRERPLVVKTLTDIGKYPELVSDIRQALQIEGQAGQQPALAETIPIQAYGIDHATDELFLPRDRIEEAIALLRYKKNLVLEGPPGVGKTLVAKRLAYLLLGERDNDRIELVQFHQSYAYEDFVQGYRPKDGGFHRVDGPFLRFCDQALQDQDLSYVFIIDEINRGNLSKIFGELLLLIEADKRSEAWRTKLTYGLDRESGFFVPPNLHIIGTMNTADRSLAMVDYALRRRFAFLSIQPAFGRPGFDSKLLELGADASLRRRIVSVLDRLNTEIINDPNLGAGFCIGHSYFCRVAQGENADTDWLQRIVRTEIAPLLREYWFDNRERAEDAVAKLLGNHQA